MDESLIGGPGGQEEEQREREREREGEGGEEAK